MNQDITITTSAGKLYLAFVLSGEHYALAIECIREIIEYDTPTPVPMMPHAVCGVINLRGAVVPVLDLSVRFGGSPVQVGRRSCYVIIEVCCQGEQHTIGLLVDRVTAVVDVADKLIEPPPSLGTKINGDFIVGMARHDGHFMIILNVEKAFSIEHMSAVVSIHPQPSDSMLAA